MTHSLLLGGIAALLRDDDLLIDSIGPEDVAVLGVSQDSRTVREGDLFLAWEGETHDAHAFVADAARAGAVAAVVERRVEVELPQLVVRNGRRAAALAAHAVLGFPGDQLTLAAVTGTNGKTTTALLLRELLSRLGPAAALGTLGVVGPDGRIRPDTEGLTTPGPVELARWLRTLVDEGVEAVALEASSHALEQHRLDALQMDAAIFTNLSQDHLDYHRNLERYRGAKARLLELLGDDGVAVINADEPAWTALPESAGGRRTTFGIDSLEADVRAADLDLGARGTRFTLVADGEGSPVQLPLPGRFNVENALAAAGAALALGVDLPDVAGDLGEVEQVPGRLERVAGTPAPVLIDFAHTPEALAAVLDALRPLVEERLIVVFGAGGDRDPGKRPLMAAAVEERADVPVLTSDNPRTEDPEAILDDLEAGLRGSGHLRIVDRREAIARALEMAREGDLVLLAGKGHETYQEVGTERRPFDERVVVREHLGAGAA